MLAPGQVIAPRNYCRIWWCMSLVLEFLRVRPQVTHPQPPGP
jgi:hypothetical protein